MGKHFIVFIHGVATRDSGYADKMVAGINERLMYNASNDPKRATRKKFVHPASSLKDKYDFQDLPNVEFVPLCWGFVNEQVLQNRLCQLKKSPAWKFLWLRRIREGLLWQFATDATLYLSPAGGEAVVEELFESAAKKLETFDASRDTLHLVCHSWGTIILLDVLFGSRWKKFELPGFETVMKFRNFLGVLSTNIDSSTYPIDSIHTMGSPISLFSLIDWHGSPNNALSTAAVEQSKPKGEAVIWNNYIHPGDAIALPLELTLSDIGVTNVIAKDILIQPGEDSRLIALILSFLSVFFLLGYPLAGQMHSWGLAGSNIFIMWLAMAVYWLLMAIVTGIVYYGCLRAIVFTIRAWMFDLPLLNLALIPSHHLHYWSDAGVADAIATIILKVDDADNEKRSESEESHLDQEG